MGTFVSDLLTNLAAVRAQYNEGESDIVRLFMPLVGYAIKQVQGEFVSEAELQEVIFNTMQFRVPLGAIRLFINRASNRRYNFITKNANGTYSPNRAVLAQVKFLERRAEATKHQAALKTSFGAFCKANFETNPTSDEIEQHFFEILFDITPQVMRSLADPIKNLLEFEEAKEPSLRYRVYRFVAHCAELNNEELRYIEEFIHGAILAESFFYTSPEDAFQKMKDVRVYLDTSLLISAIGLSEEPEVRAVRELLDLLRILKAKVRSFTDTRNELHGIIYAIDQAAREGRAISRRPGDVGDIMVREGYDLSDIKILLDSLNGALAEQGVIVEERPSPIEAEPLGIDEAGFTGKLVAEFSRAGGSVVDPMWLSFSAERRAKHDVDCLSAVFRFRSGKPMQSLERCEAVFVTSNTALVRTSAEFFDQYFKEEFGQTSQAPICIGSSVFTMLMWLKAADRKPAITKDRLVANSIAAVNPSPELWSEFMRNLRKLMDEGHLTRAEFDYISNALETRTILMTQTEGDPTAITEGTTLDIKNRVMHRLLGEKDAEIEDLKAKVASLLHRENERSANAERWVKKAERFVRIGAQFALKCACVLPFAVLLLIDVARMFEESPLSSMSVVRVVVYAFATVIAALATIYVPPIERGIEKLAGALAERVGKGVRLVVG